MTAPPLRCRDTAGNAVDLPLSDGRYVVPTGTVLTVLDSPVDLHGPIVIEPDSALYAPSRDARANVHHDGPIVILRAYLGPPEERATNELARTVVETRMGRGPGERLLPLVFVVA